MFEKISQTHIHPQGCSIVDASFSESELIISGLGEK